MSYSFISPEGEIVTTRTVREFAEQTGMAPSAARNLASGFRAKHKGWCSTSPKAGKAKKRFLTMLINTKTGEKAIVGHSVAAFAKQYGLCASELSGLLTGRLMIYKHWVTEKTWSIAYGDLTEEISKSDAAVLATGPEISLAERLSLEPGEVIDVDDAIANPLCVRDVYRF